MSHAGKNIQHDCLVSTERERIFLLIHNKLIVKERMFRIGTASDPYCTLCLDQEEGAVECDIDHYFCSCVRVASLWVKIRSLVIALLDIEDTNVSNSSIIRMNIPMNTCPGAIWIVGAFISAVWNTRDTVTICKEEFFGYLKFKFRAVQMGTRQQIETVFRMLN